MSAARTFLPAEEQGRRSGEAVMMAGVRRLGLFFKALWLAHDAMHPGRPLSDASGIELLKGSMIGMSGNFKIEATAVPTGTQIPGWRITTHDQTTNLEHEFYVREGQIRHVQFQSSPPWDHSSQFVVGGKVNRISEAEKRAILQTISDLTARISVNG